MKMTYSDQLKRPEWQRKRLEVLEAAGWQCQSCDAADKTLHVHHKQYIKGRSAWDYEISNFEALCENCHAESHHAKDLINAVLAALPSSHWHGAACLLIGWAEDSIPPELFETAYDAHLLESGSFAKTMVDLDIRHIPALRIALGKLIGGPPPGDN